MINRKHENKSRNTMYGMQVLYKEIKPFHTIQYFMIWCSVKRMKLVVWRLNFIGFDRYIRFEIISIKFHSSKSLRDVCLVKMEDSQPKFVTAFQRISEEAGAF